MSSSDPKYPATVDCPKLTTNGGDSVGIDYGINGGSYVNTSTGDVIEKTSDVHTKFSGGMDHDVGDDGGILDAVVDAVSDNCIIM
jgi:hypothetical protein